MAALLLAVGVGLRRGGGTRVRSAAPAGGVRDLLRVPGLPAAVVASLVAVSAVDVLAVYLPALGTERGLAASTVGLLLVLRALATMASRSLLAAAVARVGRSRLLMGGAVCAGTALVVLALPVPVPVLVLAVVVAGVGLGVGQPLTMSWVTLLAPERQRATAVSLRLTGNRLGQAVVPVVVGSAAGGLGAGGVLATTGTLLAGRDRRRRRGGSPGPARPSATRSRPRPPTPARERRSAPVDATGAGPSLGPWTPGQERSGTVPSAPPTSSTGSATTCARATCSCAQLGGVARFAGPVRTVRCRNDNALVKQVLSTPGDGGVLVVDGGGSLASALVGDLIAGARASSTAGRGWCCTASSATRSPSPRCPSAIKALGTNPRKSRKAAEGEVDVRGRLRRRGLRAGRVGVQRRGRHPRADRRAGARG